MQSKADQHCVHIQLFRSHTQTGGRLQQVRLAVFDPGGPFSVGDRLLRDRPWKLEREIHVHLWSQLFEPEP